jgi:hypothetical protein
MLASHNVSDSDMKIGLIREPAAKVSNLGMLIYG